MKEKFYFPLIAELAEEEYDDPTPVGDDIILDNLDNIESELDVYQEFGDTSMVEFFNRDDVIKSKLTDMYWGVCEVDNKPFGYVEVEMTEPLTPEETKALIDWISGQNSDGLGEGFEQRPIETDEGDIYVSMWNFSDSYKIRTQAEMDEYLNKYTINVIGTDTLRHMEGKEGLVLQGCGGSIAEWITGINDTFQKEGILLDNTKFRNVSTFEHNDMTNILFPIEKETHLDLGKLALWKLSTHELFGGTWMSDYVDNQLGGFIDDSLVEKQKPDCPLIGQDGNIFNLMGIASRTLKDNGLFDDAKKMCNEVMQSGSYEQALGVIGEYVNITSIYDDEDFDMGGM